MKQTVVAVCTVFVTLTAGGCGANVATVAGVAQVTGGTVSGSPRPFALPPTIAECRKTLRRACYSADLLRHAYGVDALGGLTGKGRTIAVFDMSGSPTLRADLETFSRKMGLPEPRLEIRTQKVGTAPPAVFDRSNPAQVDLAEETTLDLQAAHAFAPDAALILQQLGLPAAPVPTPSPSSPPPLTPQQAQIESELLTLGVQDIVDNTDADVISLSYGISEDRLDPSFVKSQLQPVLEKATAKGMTVLAATGDSGAAQPQGASGALTRTVNWPASAPTVTAVGGASLHLDQSGNRVSPDTVWNDPPAQWKNGKGAAGGGVSALYPRPSYQDPVRKVVGAKRGLPDLSMTADPDGGLLVYQSYTADPGWLVVGGTSEATPLFAAIVALASQKAGKRLGDVNPAIYALATPPGRASSGITDITQGTNGPDGYSATPGYDLASGWGTVDATRFVPALATRR